MKLSVIAKALDNQIDKDIEVDAVVIDSRKVQEGSLFVAIKGERFDGHDFIDSAIKNGAVAVVSAKDYEADIPVLRVDDTMEAMLKIGGAYREFYNPKLIAVTGSVGKTSTKELIYSVLNESEKTLRNEGNLNNELGVPLTLARLDESYKYAVIEMGMDKLGDIDSYCKHVKPDLGVITNIGTSHIGNLGSRENIFRAKTEMLPYIKTETLIACGDDDFLPSLRGTYPHFTSYGKAKENDIRLLDLDSKNKSFMAETESAKYELTYSLEGSHNALNALAAIGVGEFFGLSEKEIKNGIKNARLTGSRMQLLRLGDKLIIDDCYNAAYESIKMALDYFDEIKEDVGCVILGDIFEMGDFAKDGHEKVGMAVMDSKADMLVFIGENSKYGYEKARSIDAKKKLYYFADKEAFFEDMSILSGVRTFLLKASRGMAFEEILERIKDEFISI